MSNLGEALAHANQGWGWGVERMSTTLSISGKGTQTSRSRDEVTTRRKDDSKTRRVQNFKIEETTVKSPDRSSNVNIQFLDLYSYSFCHNEFTYSNKTGALPRVLSRLTPS